MQPPSHLVVVCGHAIWLGGPRAGWDESEWLIESYKRGETPTFIEHIKAGMKMLHEDERAVLAFSGGPTRNETKLSEAKSYANLAVANDFFGYLTQATASSRIILEERALDSYHNIIFSLVAFWRAHSVWPRKMTIVSHEFKRARLVDAHCGAIGFPTDRVEFVGINPPDLDFLGSSAKDLEVAAASGYMAEEKAAKMADVDAVIGIWAQDPHGTGEVLAGKRRQRNCWAVDQRLFHSDDERLRSGVKTMLLEDGGEALVDDAPKPWAQADCS